MTLGERTYRAAVATGATGFGDLSHTWETLPPEARERWEACGRMVDAATRADVVAQLHDYASMLDSDDGDDFAVRDAADMVEAGR